MGLSEQKHGKLVSELLTQYPLLDEEKAVEVIDGLIDFWDNMIDNIDLFKK